MNVHESTNIEHMKKLYVKHKFDIIRLEGIAAFQGLGQEIKRTTDLPLKMVTAVKDKITRLEAQSPKFENGKVFINKAIDKGIRDTLIEQLINNFPKHDDIRDAVILALEYEQRNFYVGAI